MQNTLFAEAPETTTAAPLYFHSMESVKTAIAEIKKDECTFERLKQLQNYFIDNEEKTAAEIVSKLTIAEINKFIYSHPGSKKSQLVKSMTEAITSCFDVCEGLLSYQYNHFGGTNTEDPRKDAQRKRFDSTTPEMYEAWKEAKRQKAEAFKKAMDNPETLEEYKTFLRYKGEATLTSEQKEIFDELRTVISKEQKQKEAERKAQISAVTMEDTELIIIETIHTKKNIPLWVVKLSDRVEKYIFNDLNSRAKQLGGYYSSYRGGGAIPGFTFERKEAAELFTQIKDGDINAAELRKAINAERTQGRAENLAVKAETINDRATEELNKDRKDNTARRARMASHAEQKAAAEIIFAITLNKIAEGIQNETIKHLTNINTSTQLETLESILRDAKWQYIREYNIKESDFNFAPEVLNFVKFPFPIIYKNYIFDTLNKLSNDKGKKLAAARMIKRLKALKPEQEFLTVTFGQCLEDYQNLFCYSSNGIDKYTCERYKNANTRLQRIIKLGITTIFELRAALRELIRIKEGVQLTPEQQKAQQIKELERKFIGKKIDGFFPTPEILAAEVVAKARIKDGDNILEPSAGLGHIAEAITEAHPDNVLTCIEYYQPLAEALEIKGFTTLNKDFLQHTGSYDKIIMNPPFENLADIDHVLHAWELLNEGGRIVAIMAGNKNRNTKKVIDFMEFLENNGTWEENPAGSFASAFRPTGVNTITVILDKPIK